MIKKNIKKHYFGIKSAFLMVALVVVMLVAFASSVVAADTTRPTILSVSPANNQEKVLPDQQVKIVFSEKMDPKTINANTIKVIQRTTPVSGSYRSLPLTGMISYVDQTAIFQSWAAPDKLVYPVLSPDQKYGNVFTVTVTTGAKDLAGNSLSRNYVWSFTTGSDVFNTGGSTSASDQSALPITGAAVQTTPAAKPPVKTAAAPIAQVTESSNVGTWILGSLFVVLLLLLVFVLAMIPVFNQKTKKASATSTLRSGIPDPFGDIHPVMDLEGIGPKNNAKLLSMGIKDTKQLWHADPVRIVRLTGANLASVKSWQQMAELASVHDIGPQYAELLERSGIRGIEHLKNYDPKKLLKLVHKKQDSIDVRIQGNVIGHATVQNWIKEARNHRHGDLMSRESVAQTA